MRKMIKIKIGLETTTIWYNNRHIKDRWEAIKITIDHLKRMLEVFKK